MPQFDRQVRPTIDVGPVTRTRPNQVSLTVRWDGDPDKRFLPNVEAHIVCTRDGRTSTQVEIIAVHTSSRPTRRANLEFVARRIVRSSLDRFLERLADELEGFEEHAVS